MADDRIHPMFADLWPDSVPRVEERMAAVERGLDELATGSLSEHARAGAHAAAHKLVGTLGTYGLLDASGAARALADAFASPGGPPAEAEPELRARYEAMATTVRSVNVPECGL